jgi:hypothetical protein
MDEQRVSSWSIDNLPVWAMLGFVAYVAAGIAVGTCYFRAVWWSARLFALGGRAATATALVIGRFILLGGLLALASFEGPLPLLVIALGILIARSAVMYRVRKVAP